MAPDSRLMLDSSSIFYKMNCDSTQNSFQVNSSENNYQRLESSGNGPSPLSQQLEMEQISRNSDSKKETSSPDLHQGQNYEKQLGANSVRTVLRNCNYLCSPSEVASCCFCLSPSVPETNTSCYLYNSNSNASINLLESRTLKKLTQEISPNGNLLIRRLFYDVCSLIYLSLCCIIQESTFFMNTLQARFNKSLLNIKTVIYYRNALEHDGCTRVRSFCQASVAQEGKGKTSRSRVLQSSSCHPSMLSSCMSSVILSMLSSCVPSSSFIPPQCINGREIKNIEASTTSSTEGAATTSTDRSSWSSLKARTDDSTPRRWISRTCGSSVTSRGLDSRWWLLPLVLVLACLPNGEYTFVMVRTGRH